jgi:hypothetical protein
MQQLIQRAFRGAANWLVDVARNFNLIEQLVAIKPTMRPSWTSRFLARASLGTAWVSEEIWRKGFTMAVPF